MQHNQTNETAYVFEEQIRKKHRTLIVIAAIIILFYLLFPLALISFISEQNTYFLPLAWGYVLLLFLITWGVGVWHYFFIKSCNRKLEARWKQTNAGDGQ